MSALTEKQIRDEAYRIATGHHLTESFNYEEFQHIDVEDYSWELTADWPICELESHIENIAESIVKLAICARDIK